MKVLSRHFLNVALFCGLISGGLLWAGVAEATDSITTTLNKSTLESGYTVYNPSRTFELGIRPRSITRAKQIRVHLRKAKASRYSTTNQTQGWQTLL